MSYKITLQPDEQVFWAERGESVLEAALKAGQVLPYSCRGGSCGACMGKLLIGQVDYRDGRPAALSEREQAEGQALFCQAQPLSDLVIEARTLAAVGDIVIKSLPCRVINMQMLAADVMRLYIKLPATERLQFLAGQYIDIMLRDGRRRSFSLANPPHVDEHLELHIRQVPDGEFTQFVFTEMKEKAILRFQGPLGTFFLREDSQRPIIMMAGGTGFAPLKSILEDAFYKNITRPIHLYWGVRSRRDLYLKELPESWVDKYSNFSFIPVLSEPLAEDDWHGRSGWVHAAVAEDFADLSRHEVYMSGPPPMIEAAKKVFAQCGLAADCLFFDSFDYAPDSQIKS